MNVSALIWIALVLAGALAGIALAIALATSHAVGRLLTGLSVVALGGSGYGVGLLAQGDGGSLAAGAGAALLVSGLGAGWLVASALLMPRPRPNRIEATTTGRRAEDVPCVLVFACIEPATYRLGATRDRIASLLAADGQDASLLTLPLLYLAHRSRYDVAGGTNPGAQQLRACVAQVSRALASRADAADGVDCGRSGSLVSRVATALRSGCGTCVVVSPAVIRTSVEDARIAGAADFAGEMGGRLQVLDLSDSVDLVRDVLISRVLAAVSDPAASGVVLLSMASIQPDHAPGARADNVEAAFLGSLSVALFDAGFAEATVRIAWARDAETQALEHVRHLALQGLSRIVMVQASIPFDTLDSVIETDLARRTVSEQCEVVSVGGWGSDERICAELARLVIQARDVV